MVYLLMFITAFSSATLIPMGSEAVLIYNIEEGNSASLLFFVAVIGNTLGAFVNYYLGFKGEEFLIRKRYLKEKFIQKYKIKFDKYGALMLLLAWVPIIGDGFTFIAGILKYNLFKFFIFVFLSKFFRYIVVIYFYYLYQQ